MDSCLFDSVEYCFHLCLKNPCKVPYNFILVYSENPDKTLVLPVLLMPHQPWNGEGIVIAKMQLINVSNVFQCLKQKYV